MSATLFDELLEAARLPVGICRFCGCSEFDACIVDDGLGPIGCHWIDRRQRICSACVAAARAERHHVGALSAVTFGPPTAWVRATWLRAFHLGFLVGWFAVSPRTAAGRSTYLRSAPPRALEAWQRGQRAGEAARQAYGRACGQVTTLPRAAVLAVYAGRQAGRPNRRRSAADCTRAVKP
jgi:hypothetical protein